MVIVNPETSAQLGPATRSPRAEGIFWFYAAPIAVMHLLACLALVPYFFSWTGVVSVAVGLYLFATLGINLGYHRLLAHRSLQVPRWLEYCLTTLALCSLQTTPSRWVATHRLHHNHSDDPEDPHSPEETFFWSHIGWLLYRNSSLQSAAVYDKYARDLLSDPYYWWLEKRPWRSPAIYLAHAALIFLGGALAGWALWGSQAALQFGLSLLVWGVFLRTVLVWHITWSVNSLTHLFGYRTYETDENSRNNWFVGLVAMGEGWHNNHHHDPASASVQHRWWEFDPTYYSIRVLESVGLARKVIRPRHVRKEAAGAGQE